MPLVASGEGVRTSSWVGEDRAVIPTCPFDERKLLCTLTRPGTLADSIIRPRLAECARKLQVVGAISLLSFIIACATLASWYIAAADAVSNNSVYSTYYSTGGVASSLRFQAAMLVFGVLFSLAQIALSAVVVQKQGQLEQAAAVVFPYVPRNRAAMMMMQQPPVIMVVQGGNQGVAMPQQGQGQYYAQYQQPQQQMQMQQMQVQASYAQQPIPTATVMQPGQVAVVENGKVEVAAEVTGVAVPAQTTKSVDV